MTPAQRLARINRFYKRRNYERYLLALLMAAVIAVVGWVVITVLGW